VHDQQTRREAIELVTAGVPVLVASRRLGVSRDSIRTWCRDPDRALRPPHGGRCFRCTGVSCPEPVVYGYLLGQYLGDGYLVASQRVPKLRIACADTYPMIAAEVDRAMACLSGNKVGRVGGIGCSDHHCHWKHWPCLFPQHGPGMKHTRPIVLEPWQRDIVDEHPWPLIRGLIHSDGCRAINRVVVRGKAYEYPRYFFANESADILGIMGAALDRVGVAWRFNRRNSISIARRGAVAIMDEHIGPKR
jgi:hypothetical protein